MPVTFMALKYADSFDSDFHNTLIILMTLAVTVIQYRYADDFDNDLVTLGYADDLTVVILRHVNDFDSDFHTT